MTEAEYNYESVWIVGTPVLYPGTNAEGRILNSIWRDRMEALEHAEDGQVVELWGIHASKQEAPSAMPKSRGWWRNRWASA